MHVDDNVSREKLAGGLGFLTALDLLYSFGGDQNLEHKVSKFVSLDTFDDIVVDFLFLSGEDVNNEPLIFWSECHDIID